MCDLRATGGGLSRVGRLSNPLSQHAPKASWALFEGLFIIAALVAVFATFITIAGVNPDNPTAGSTPWLLALNLVLIIALAVVRGKPVKGVWLNVSSCCSGSRR